MPDKQNAITENAAPAPGSAALLDRTLACHVCGKSVGRTHAPAAPSAPAGPSTRPGRCLGAAEEISAGLVCLQCAQPATRFKGAVSLDAAGQRENVVLAEARGHNAGGKGAEAAGASGAGGGERGEAAGQVREFREERPDGNTAGKQADDTEEQEKEVEGGRGSGRAHHTGGARSASTTARGAGARSAGVPASASITARGASARTAGAPASASIAASETYARTAGQQDLRA